MSRSAPIGTTINGYRIERILSEAGKFSIVYLAYDTDADRIRRRKERIAGRLGRWGERYGPEAANTAMDPGPLVALKEYIPQEFGLRRGGMVAPQSNQSQIFAWGRERFARESKFLSEHSHPNVVAVYDRFTANNTEYYVMEQLTGGSLAEVVRRGGSQSETEIRGWLLPLLAGLASVERRDADHLDISPDNIMFRKPHQGPVLVDFGVSRIPGTSPVHASRRVNNDAFSAPEKDHFTSSKLSSRSDIYSIAAVIFYTLTGEAPASAPARVAGGAAISSAAAELRARHASAAFLRVIDQAFSINSQERFSDARAFLEALAASAGQAPLASPQRSKPSATSKTSVISLPMLLGMAALLIVLLLVLLIMIPSGKN